VKKRVEIDPKANKELLAFTEEVQARFYSLFRLLESEGFLKEPFAKRINSKLFELRVKHGGQWRALYAYVIKEKIVILSCFTKKTQKTPRDEIKKAEKRLKGYI